MTHIHIHAPQPVEKRVLAGCCPDCKKRTRFLAYFVEWYGWDQTCLRCGRGFNDGEWERFPSHRYARRGAIAAAKARWRRTKVVPPSYPHEQP